MDRGAIMKTIVVVGQKGGSGKTTLIAHLAVAAEAAGDGPVVVVDGDPQRSLTTWRRARKAPSPEFSIVDLQTASDDLAALDARGFSFCLVDTAPVLSGRNRRFLETADCAVMPVQPSASDLWALGAALDVVKEAGVPYAFVLTQAKAHAHLTMQTLAALSGHGRVLPVIMHNRVDYAAALTDGRTAAEIRPDGRAAFEMAELWTSVRDWVRDPERGLPGPSGSGAAASGKEMVL